MKHNRKFHLVFGIIITVILDYIVFDYGSGFLSHLTSDPFRLFMLSVSAGFGSMLPDYLEPPKNAKHRGFLHSYSFGFILLIILVYTISLNTLGSRIVFYTITGYLSHLLYDSTTRRGLPWV